MINSMISTPIRIVICCSTFSHKDFCVLSFLRIVFFPHNFSPVYAFCSFFVAFLAELILKKLTCVSAWFSVVVHPNVRFLPLRNTKYLTHKHAKICNECEYITRKRGKDATEMYRKESRLSSRRAATANGPQHIHMKRAENIRNFFILHPCEQLLFRKIASY